MKVILVPVANREECKVALNAGFNIATRLNSSVSGVHIRPHRDDSKSASQKLWGGPYRFIPGVEWYKSELDDLVESQAALELFEDIADKYHFNIRKRPTKKIKNMARWHEMVGDPNRVFSIMGPLSDLIIVSRPLKKSRGQAHLFINAALFHSGRPIMMLPQKPLKTVGERILIAWNQKTEVMQTIAAMMPLLQHANTVHIVTCGPENRPGPKMKHLQDYLRCWGVETEKTVMPGKNVSSEIEKVFKQTQSDLLLMGAYSRGKLTEWLLGGTTQYVLSNSQLPVVMMH
ncbi:universal stress protein [Marinicella sp. W31]|uniref:universal stress protein n=1 Tax=Marinicella sp. W31 TaxID=3023713 RepID=UPI00375819FB